MGGVLTWLVIGTVGIIAVVFRKTVLLGLKKIFNLEPAKSTIDAPSQPVQPAPQEVVLRLAGIPSVQSAAQPEITSPTIIPRSAIPRPPLAGFVARRDESGRDIVERLKEELLPDKEQLIVLWGAGGVGKTTLAAEVARAMRHVFVGGIVWTSADGKPDYGLSSLLDEIVTELGQSDLRQLAPQPKEEAVDQLLSTTAATLIVLDNFETISPPEQERCANWLANRSSCSALITSRHQVSHARPVRILAMSLPEAQEFLQRLTSELGNPTAFEGLDRQRIIEAADRIPRVMQWVVSQIGLAREARTVLDELSHGEGDAVQRVFDRSFDLPQLGDDGRATLLALSLFVPSASRAALAEVAGLANADRLDLALQHLSQLWLVQTTRGNERLKVEGLTRELTKARIESMNGDEYRRRFVGYFNKYVDGHSENTSEHYDALEAEKDNLLQAIEMAFELADWDNVQRLSFGIALPVSGMLSVRGYWSEAVRANQLGLQAAKRSNDQISIADSSINLAIMHGNRGEIAEARRLCNECLAINKELDDKIGIARSLHQLAMLSQDEGDLAEARQLLNESLAIARDFGDERGISVNLHHLAMLAHDEGDLAEARGLYNESLELERKLGDERGISTGLHQLGLLAQKEGNWEEARTLYEQSLAIASKLGVQSQMATSLAMLGQLAEEEGNDEEAERLSEKALAIFDRLRSPNAEIVREQLGRLKAKVKNR